MNILSTAVLGNVIDTFFKDEVQMPPVFKGYGHYRYGVRHFKVQVDIYAFQALNGKNLDFMYQLLQCVFAWIDAPHNIRNGTHH